jgi:hypothetical protein
MARICILFSEISYSLDGNRIDPDNKEYYILTICTKGLELRFCRSDRQRRSLYARQSGNGPNLNWSQRRRMDFPETGSSTE